MKKNILKWKFLLPVIVLSVILISLGSNELTVHGQTQQPSSEDSLRFIIKSSFPEEPLILNLEIKGEFAGGSILLKKFGEVISGEGVYFLAFWNGSTWEVYFEGTKDFRDLLVIIPNEILTNDQKAVLDYETGEDTIPLLDSTKGTGYKLPWPGGVTYYVWGAWTTGTCPHYSNAFDTEMPLNSTLVAARSGIVMTVKQDSKACGCTDDNLPKGNWVIIKHDPDDGLYDWYVHIAQNGSLVSVGQRVTQGQPIAKSHQIGKTCSSRNFTCATGTCPYDATICKPFPHLHFEVRNSSGTKIYTTFDDVGAVVGCNYYKSGNYYDTTPPVSTAALSGTMGENGWYRSNVVAAITATDNASGVNYSQYNLNGAGWVNYTSPVTISVNGSNTLQYRSVDKAGNWESVKTTTIKIDTGIPSNPTDVSSGCSALDDKWQNSCEDPNFAWSGASDTISGVGDYQYYWGTDVNGTSTNTTDTAGYDPPAVSDGLYYLRVRTKDNAGNWSGWITLFTLRYEGTPPTGLIFIENDWEIINRTLVSVYSEANDNMSGVEQYRLRNSGETWTDWMPYGNTSLWLLPQITDKTYVVEAEFKDKAGNISGTKNDAIYLDIYPNRPKSNSYLLRKSTFGMAGIKATSTNYGMVGTLAQQSVVGTAESENYQASLGFWNKFFQTIIEYFNIYLPILTK